MNFDLHVHTNYSDGLLSYEEVIDLAIKKGLSGIAITDHDTVAAIGPAVEYSKDFQDFCLIPGIEFSSTYNDEEVHILGYFIDYTSYDIVKVTKKLQESRNTRSLKIIEKLNDLGINISIDEVGNLDEDVSIGRPHIARVLVEKGYVVNIKEAFDKYLAFGEAAYVDRYKLGIKETIDLINKSGGISILAHPGLLKDKKVIKHCIELGIDGLEFIHSEHDENEVISFSKTIKKYNLIGTGGSDCHGQLIGGEYLLGKYYIDLKQIPRMKGRI